MNTKHTPGPWKFQKYANNDADRIAAEKVGIKPVLLLDNSGSAPIMSVSADKRVALVDCQSKVKRGEGWRTECAEREANAKLIAAAPELLEALQGLINGAEAMGWDSAKKARAAIEKATT